MRGNHYSRMVLITSENNVSIELQRNSCEKNTERDRSVPRHCLMLEPEGTEEYFICWIEKSQGFRSMSFVLFEMWNVYYMALQKGSLLTFIRGKEVENEQWCSKQHRLCPLNHSFLYFQCNPWSFNFINFNNFGLISQDFFQLSLWSH